MQPDPCRVPSQVINALDKLDVPLPVGGSLARAVRRFTRTTVKADVGADLKPEMRSAFTPKLCGKHYGPGDPVT